MGPISLKECNGAVLNRLKIIRGLGPPQFPHQVIRGPNFPIARVSNLPIASPNGPQMFNCAIKGPFSCFPPSGHLAPPPTVSHYFIKGFQFPHCVMKGPKIFHCAIKGPQFPHHVTNDPMTSNFPSRYREVSLRHQGAPIVTSNFRLRYQGVPIYHCVIKGPQFPHRVIKGIQISKIHHVYSLWDMNWFISAVEYHICL